MKGGEKNSIFLPSIALLFSRIGEKYIKCITEYLWKSGEALVVIFACL